MGSVSRRTFLAGAAALVFTARARAADGFSVKNARILIGDGTETKGGIRVAEGKIVAVGPEVADGEDLGGAVVYPGMWVGGAPIGLWEVDLEAGTHDDGEAMAAVVPQARVVDGYNPRSEVLPVCRVGGILGALVIPTAGVVAGQAAWMRTFGESTAEATVRDPAGVLFRLGHAGTGAAGGPTSRMGVATTIRDLFDANPIPDPPAPPKKLKKGEEPPKPPTYTAAQQTLHALRRKETKAIFAVERASDIRAALDLVAAYGLDGVLLGCAEGHLVAKDIAAAGLPVLLGPVTTQPSSFDTLAARYDNAALLHGAGVKLALRVGGAHNARDLTTEAGIAVAYGLPWERAIAAISGAAPGFWGLDVGVLRAGAEASFVMTDGDPLQPRTRVLRTWGRGVEMPVRSRQTELYERFR